MTDWQSRASCLGHPRPEIWFPEQGQAGQEAAKEAKAICRECPVREECFDYAVRNQERHGIWGGEVFGRRAAVRRMQTPRVCEIDGTTFIKQFPAQRYCSDACTALSASEVNHRYYETHKRGKSDTQRSVWLSEDVG